MPTDTNSNLFQEFSKEMKDKLNTKLYAVIQDKKREIAAKMVNATAIKESESEYQKFFKKKLEKYGVKSPAELGDQKTKFFDEIEAEWTKDSD